MDRYFARQPILDKNLRLYGYELLFRPNPDAQTAGSMPMQDGDSATATVLDVLNANGIDKVTGGCYAFVNFTRKLLLEGVATLYPKDFLVVEILESFRKDKEVLRAIATLKEAGYMIVLDDYVYSEGDERLLALADIIKVEMDGGEDAYRVLADVAARVKSTKCRLLAEKVETQEVFDRAKNLGCTLFQGYFFARPKTVLNKTVNPLKVNQIRLVNELAREDFDFDSVAKIVKNDVALSYKTLRLVNSVYYSARHEIKNINQAVVFLGAEELKKWLVFASMSELGDNKPSELIIMSMARAYFCEHIAGMTQWRREAESFFMAGLFSLLDTITDNSIESCLEAMSVPQSAADALLEKDNPGRYAIELIIALENGRWEQVSRLCALLGVEEQKVPDVYVDALKWAKQYT